MKSKMEMVANIATLVASIFVLTLVGSQLRDRWLVAAPQPLKAGEVEHVNNVRITIPKATLKGAKQAKVVLIEFSDFQCPFCGVYARNTAPAIHKEFVNSGKILYGFRNFPLTHIHSFAMPAGRAALCAGDQHQFWPMHDRLFENQKALDIPDLLTHADQLGLDRTQFNQCLDSKLLNEDMAEAKLASVTSTPTFLIGLGQSDGTVRVLSRIRGSQSLSTFRTALQEALRVSTN
jgi:protein-disulfide isomerase